VTIIESIMAMKKPSDVRARTQACPAVSALPAPPVLPVLSASPAAPTFF